MYSEPSDRFLVGGTALRYESASGSAWEIIAEQIRCIGEATGEAGRADETWNLCFVLDAHGTWVEGSLYAQDRNDALQWLSVRLGCSFELKLANAPAFRSRVMWPKSMLERPLFEYQVTPLRRIFSRAARRLGLAPIGGVQAVRAEVLEKMEKIWRKPASPSA